MDWLDRTEALPTTAVKIIILLIFIMLVVYLPETDARF